MAADDRNGEDFEAELERRRRQRYRSIAIAVALGLLVLLFYVATIVRLGGNVFNRPI
ncbi:MAG TPA: hypothetical protein VF226_15080 [Hyphomicrobiaceae bacterium]